MSHPTNITDLISAAVAPVVLITATAILLSAYSAKYTSLGDRMRTLTAEYRLPETSAERRANIKRQISVFHRRINAMWTASILLSLALLAFLGTVLSVLLALFRGVQLGFAVIATVVMGLAMMVGSVCVELSEIRMARLTIAGELTDIYEDPPRSNSS